MKLYFFPTVNPLKVALLLEETGIPYEMVPVEIRKGQQFDPDYLALNPNAKTPVLVDGKTVIFDSTAILLYLAEETKMFIGDGSPAQRGELLSWLMFVATGVGPFSGQAVYFRHFQPKLGSDDDAAKRYAFEAERHWTLIEQRLSRSGHLAGDGYSIADIALWPWARALPRILGEGAFAAYPAVKYFVDVIDARPAAQRALALGERHSFKTEMDADATAQMFRYRDPARNTSA